MRVLIVDDEPLAVEWLASCLAETADVELVGVARDGVAALEQAAALTPDLVLLDVQMPGCSGVDVARVLGGQAGPEVVFVTAFADHAPAAFDLDAADYLLKPVAPDRLAEALQRARRRRRLRQLDDAPAPPPPDRQRELWIPHRDGQVRVLVEDIRRVEANRDYVLIHTRLRSYLLRMTMAELGRRLDPRQIARVHRSAFVRLDIVRRVERVGRSLLRLHTDDGAVVEVGASYAKAVLGALGLDADDA